MKKERERLEAEERRGPDDGNDQWCRLCDDGGELMCCEFCPRAYHLECLVKTGDITEAEARRMKGEGAYEGVGEEASYDEKNHGEGDAGAGAGEVKEEEQEEEKYMCPECMDKKVSLVLRALCKVGGAGAEKKGADMLPNLFTKDFY